MPGINPTELIAPDPGQWDAYDRPAAPPVPSGRYLMKAPDSVTYEDHEGLMRIVVDNIEIVDAPDGKPVDILFVLLVPEEAQQQHLDILASIAGLFSQKAFCGQIRQTADSASLYTTATNWSS